MLQYLFAAFSLKQDVREGVTAGAARRDPALAQDAARDQRAGDAPPRARPEPADRGRRGAALRPPELPDAGVRLPGGRPDRAAAVRRGGAPPLRVPRAARGHGRRRRRGVRGHRAGRRLGARHEDEIVPHLQEFETIGAALPGHRRGARAPRGPDRRGAAVHRAGERPGDRGALPLGGARRGDRPRVGAARRSTRSSSRARAPRASGATRTSGGCWASSTTTSRQGGRPRLRARAAGRGGERPAAGDRRRRAAHHGPGHGAGDGPAQRRLRGPAPAPLALLRPHRRDARAAARPRRRLGGADVRGDQAARVGRDDAADRLGHAGRHRGPGVRAVLPGRLPAAPPRGGVGPDGGAAAGRGGVRRPLRRGVHAGAHGAAGQGGEGARAVRGPAAGGVRGGGRPA